MDELADVWILHLTAERRSPNTRRSYRAGVDAYLNWCTAHDLPRALDRTQVVRWLGDLMDGGAEAATGINRLRSVKRFSAWLTSEDEQGADPLLGLKAPSNTVKAVNPLTEDEIVRLFAASKGPGFRDLRDTAILRVMLETGARASEIVGMDVPDTDIYRGIALLRRAKGGKERIVSFGPQTAKAIEAWMRKGRRTHRSADKSPALWFGDHNRGERLSYPTLYDIVGTRAHRAGLGPVNPHRLRNTWATRWLEAGGSEGGLMAIAGWSQRSMVDRYTKATASARAAEESKRLDLGNL